MYINYTSFYLFLNKGSFTATHLVLPLALSFLVSCLHLNPC